MYIDRTGQSRQRSRVFQKRTWLTNLLSLGAGVTVSVLGSVANSYDGVTLPTRVDSNNPVVRSNPFVAVPNSPAVFGGGTIRQTSDLQLSELQLKSIGTAVGLVPIGNPRPKGPVLEVSRPSQAKVRVNPLATKSANNFDLPVIGLVEESSQMLSAPASVAPVAKKTTEFAQRSSTRILGLKYIESATPDTIPATPVATQAVPHQQMAPAPEPVIVVANPGVSSATKTAETVKAAADEDEPFGISFSFSDFADDGSEPSSDTIAIVETEDIPTEEVVLDTADGLLIPPPSEAPIQRDSAKLAGTVDSLPLLPTPNPAWTEHTNSDSSVAVDESKVIRYPERRRAHVEVVAPPMISFLLEPNHDSQDAARVDSTRIVPAKMAGFRVKSAQVSESSSTVERERENKQKPVDRITVLNAKIRKSCPSARLQMSEIKGKILVRGVCATQEEATEVIRMIRNEFLVSVDDQIVIR